MPEQETETVTEQKVRVRRSPRYARFMIVGAVFFVLVAFVLTYSLPEGAGYDRNGVFAYMALVAIAVGVTLGAVIALLLDRVSSRRAKTIAADRADVREAVDPQADIVATTDAPADSGQSADPGQPAKPADPTQQAKPADPAS